jgi:transcriptional/translational regulatory protein YebC/TACO1
MTAKTNAQRQKAYKDAQKAAGFVRLEGYVTFAQREKLKALGGDAWLRKAIDRAKVPEK